MSSYLTFDKGSSYLTFDKGKIRWIDFLSGDIYLILKNEADVQMLDGFFKTLGLKDKKGSWAESGMPIPNNDMPVFVRFSNLEGCITVNPYEDMKMIFSVEEMLQHFEVVVPEIIAIKEKYGAPIALQLPNNFKYDALEVDRHYTPNENTNIENSLNVGDIIKSNNNYPSQTENEPEALAEVKKEFEKFEEDSLESPIDNEYYNEFLDNNEVEKDEEMRIERKITIEPHHCRTKDGSFEFITANKYVSQVNPRPHYLTVGSPSFEDFSDCYKTLADKSKDWVVALYVQTAKDNNGTKYKSMQLVITQKSAINTEFDLENKLLSIKPNNNVNRNARECEISGGNIAIGMNNFARRDAFSNLTATPLKSVEYEQGEYAPIQINDYRKYNSKENREDFMGCTIFCSLDASVDEADIVSYVNSALHTDLTLAQEYDFNKSKKTVYYNRIPTKHTSDKYWHIVDRKDRAEIRAESKNNLER